MTAFRVLVCGGRDYTKDWVVYDALRETACREGALVVIEGGARGADAAAAKWSEAYQWDERMCAGHVQFKADWRRLGRAAGPERNARMLTEGYPDLVLAFPGGAGTGNMVRLARRAGVPVEIIKR